jgi:hypothetical protein
LDVLQKQEGRRTTGALRGNSTVLSPPIITENRTASPRAAEIFSRAKISHVFEALTGRQPKPTGKGTFRGVAAWRAGAKGLNVSLDDSRGVWHDFVSGDGGGILCLIMRLRGCSKQDALKWLSEFTGVPLEDKPMSAGEKARYAERQRLIARELPRARDWRRAAIDLCEETLDHLRAAFFDPTLGTPDTYGMRDVTRQLTRLQQMDGAALVDEYVEWCNHSPELTAAMVATAQARELAEMRALREYIAMYMVEASAA